MTRLAGLTILVVLSWAASSAAQQLSTAVYPSEDELIEALELGEISFSEFIILQEIIVIGLDSTDLHLLDRIPNLSIFLGDTLGPRTELQQEQQQAFVSRADSRTSGRTRIKYAYYQRLDEPGPARYRSLARVNITPLLTATVDIRKEFNGRERVSARSISYRAPAKTLAEIKFGSYTKRFGLGNIVGYRGKILERSSRLDSESLAFPDYGGANGFFVLMKPGQVWSLQTAVSTTRDDQHRLTNLAAMISRKTDNFELAAIAGSSKLTERTTGGTISDIKIGLFSHLTYDDGHAALEVTRQFGERDGFGGLSLEGRHSFRQADIRYAAWTFGDDYLDLTGGSKTGDLSQRDSLASIAFGFSSRRRGASGGMFKTIVPITSDIQLVNSLIGSALSRDSTSVQFLTGIINRLRPGLSVRLDYLSQSLKKVITSASRATGDRRTRLEGRFRSRTLSARGYIGYHTQTDRKDYLSIFVRFGVELQGLGRLDLWSKLGRWNMQAQRIDNWYGFLSHRQEILSDLLATIKFSHSYRRQPSRRHQTTLSLEVTALLW